MRTFLASLALAVIAAALALALPAGLAAWPRDACGVGPPPPGCSAGCLWDYSTCLCFCGDGSGNFTCENQCAQAEAACSAKCGL